MNNETSCSDTDTQNKNFGHILKDQKIKLKKLGFSDTPDANKNEMASRRLCSRKQNRNRSYQLHDQFEHSGYQHDDIFHPGNEDVLDELTKRNTESNRSIPEEAQFSSTDHYFYEDDDFLEVDCGDNYFTDQTYILRTKISYNSMRTNVLALKILFENLSVFSWWLWLPRRF